MWSKSALHYAVLIAVYSSVALLILMAWRKELGRHKFLAAFLTLRGLQSLDTLVLLYHHKALHLNAQQTYDAFFYTYWPLNAMQGVTELLIIFSVYRIAMRPLEGLQRMGTIIFAWVSTVSLILSTVIALGPHSEGLNELATLIGQIQEGISVLTVCLLVFVCFAARPLGLNFRSRAFGVALGLGLNSTIGLVLAAWFSNSSMQSVYAPVFACGAIAGLVPMFVWSAYFVLPEPERRMVTLPTTSPYFFWNSISEALGDEPGVVAVAGFTPSMLAPAEMAALSASVVPTERPETAPAAAHAIAAGF